MQPTCSTALATARMMVSRPTAASAMLVTLGGTDISSRSGSTIMAGRSTVSSWLSRFCEASRQAQKQKMRNQDHKQGKWQHHHGWQVHCQRLI
jgi:hypothetical protein